MPLIDRLENKNKLTILVNAAPKAKKERIKRIDKNQFKVWVKEPPIKGQANLAITKVLANHFRVNLSNVFLVKGKKSKHKTFIIQLRD